MNVNLSPSGSGASAEPRRRSVHFDACPTTLIVEDTSGGLGTNLEEDEDLDEDLVGSPVSLTVSKPSQERRKSAPASSLRHEVASSSTTHPSKNSQTSFPSTTLQALDPELRRSLTKLCCTTIEDTEDDLELVNFKLLGRDELEMGRLKQMKHRATPPRFHHSMDKKDDDDDDDDSIDNPDGLPDITQSMREPKKAQDNLTSPPNPI